MDILIIGSGGREHALVWKLAQSSKVRKIFVAPGNAGTSFIATNLGISEPKEILKWIDKNKIDLVVVGPDNYLAEGIVDMLQENKIPVFGPTKAAARIEWSKSFAKKFMKEVRIPTAHCRIFNNYNQALKYLQTQRFPSVIKADGLALGKGVAIVKNIKEAKKALVNMMEKEAYGSAGKKVVIEEYMEGKEVSIHAFCDGEHAILFPLAKDYKRIFDGDIGPNTGGMGTIVSVPGVSDKEKEEIAKKIVLPTLAALKKRGYPFTGILYPGVMITKEGPKVIEFNARFGDPETQSYMRILETDLLDILLASVRGKLKSMNVQWNKDYACCVVCASDGYPGKYASDKTISGLDKIPNKNIVLFHAGTKIKGDQILTNGGRVLGITATGRTLNQALSRAYTATKRISFPGMFFRKDIGK